MAARTLSTAPNRIIRLECNHNNPFLPTWNTLGLPRLQNSWLGIIAIKLSINFINVRPFLPKYPPIKATVSFSLPTAKPEPVASTEKMPKWSSKAIKSFAMAELEARKIKSPTTGTNFASKFLWANGITLLKVREEIVKLRGKPDLYFFSPEHPPLTEDAQRALDWAIDEKIKSGNDGEITTTHLLLGVWMQEESPGYKVLTALGFSNEKSKELHSLISEPEFVD
ncbi:ATP-dependent Clp protease ATP-binding subunit CLPT2, chloroplastic-like isoform X2 [Olea europaea var. sylvestris]|uniref:ATP-dependent Clp protease ATP-binding subunit CLPT2, chloroplastic-like n=1 Tax=Olea europaea subsp. europaea TaxID=158383 RepID=A0A8S0RHZ6_OLEEU|nr:ATP-dependent Clp protease ATP-binding subunit CLPT2, chloroplastic-like isoform X2 [Olea europaea var. sylvestris]CAA2978942.1 ATP-dependent Clp protease ATP-binding subunit CLPT2, chloroplastic-like [Olea europaea subsp. europaea]